MRLGRFDKVATDPGSPFGSGVSSFGGGGGTAAGGTPGEANPNRSGPPPAAAGASHMLRCNECGKMVNDGGELDEHLRTEHFVRNPMASRDVTVPAALIFIDSLGDTIPFKKSFTFKELDDFCQREGINLMASEPLTENDLLLIAENISTLTQNHIEIAAKPTRSASREPLSTIDLNVAERAANRSKSCRECHAKIASHRLFCDDCQNTRLAQITHEPLVEKTIQLYAHVTLQDGTSLHVVEASTTGFIGVDDLFQARAFTAADASTVHNMDEELQNVEAARCDVCGEDNFAFNTKCATCGYAFEKN